MKAFLVRDCRLALNAGSTVLTTILLFATFITITPFAIGPDQHLLMVIGPGVLWIGALFATLLGLDRIFQADRDDGSLDLIMMSQAHNSLALVVFSKCVAHWITTVLPLVLIAPLLSLILNLPLDIIALNCLALLIGTPAITFLGGIGAALTASLPRGGVLLSVIVLPLTIPIIIFGVSSVYAYQTPDQALWQPLLILAALTIFFAVVGSIAAAAALKSLSD